MRISFEPTYKELKHLPVWKLLIQPRRFEPTYKELKQTRGGRRWKKEKKFWAYL